MDDSAGGVQLPHYRSHKEVWALKIDVIARDQVSGDFVIKPVEYGYAPFRVSSAYVQKHQPKPGGYYVRYRDGYESWSPASEFEDGYTAIGDGGTHGFAGQPDGRQSNDTNEPVSRFRPRHRALTEDEKTLHDELKAAFASVETLIERIKPGRYRALAFTALEESCMWSVKELTG